MRTFKPAPNAEQLLSLKIFCQYLEARQNIKVPTISKKKTAGALTFSKTQWGVLYINVLV